MSSNHSFLENLSLVNLQPNETALNFKLFLSTLNDTLICYIGLLLKGAKEWGREERSDGKKKGKKRLTEVEKEGKDAQR